MATAANLQVVVVDDQQSIRGLVRTGLRQIGITNVCEFGTAKDAIRHIRGAPAHLVISDFNMPEIDGLEFLRVVRADRQLKSIGFILLTGRADRELVQRAAQFGANNYIVKPFTVAGLKQKIEQVVGTLT
jgi:two-component system chemotaxis response regulator CheY